MGCGGDESLLGQNRCSERRGFPARGASGATTNANRRSQVFRRMKATAVSETARAKLFMHGRSQAVRLPKEFRLPGKEVRVRREGQAVVLEPIEFDVKAWLAELARYHDVPFMEDGRQ